MLMTDYQELALRTQAPQWKIRQQYGELPLEVVQLDNAIRGLVNEVGELSSITKRVIEYGAHPDTMDKTNVKEEIGDCLWRLSQAADAVGTTLLECMQLNIAKLQRRYPEGYSDLKADNRDLDGERAVLETQTPKWDFSETVTGRTSSLKSNMEEVSKDRELVAKALASGWVIHPLDRMLILPGDTSQQWAAEWRIVSLTNLVSAENPDLAIVRVPHWLERRVQELETERQSIQQYTAAPHVGTPEDVENTTQITVGLSSLYAEFNPNTMNRHVCKHPDLGLWNYTDPNGNEHWERIDGLVCYPTFAHSDGYAADLRVANQLPLFDPNIPSIPTRFKSEEIKRHVFESGFAEPPEEGEVVPCETTPIQEGLNPPQGCESWFEYANIHCGLGLIYSTPERLISSVAQKMGIDHAPYDTWELLGIDMDKRLKQATPSVVDTVDVLSQEVKQTQPRLLSGLDLSQGSDHTVQTIVVKLSEVDTQEFKQHLQEQLEEARRAGLRQGLESAIEVARDIVESWTDGQDTKTAITSVDNRFVALLKEHNLQ